MIYIVIDIRQILREVFITSVINNHKVCCELHVVNDRLWALILLFFSLSKCSNSWTMESSFDELSWHFYGRCETTALFLDFNRFCFIATASIFIPANFCHLGPRKHCHLRQTNKQTNITKRITWSTLQFFTHLVWYCCRSCIFYPVPLQKHTQHI